MRLVKAAKASPHAKFYGVVLVTRSVCLCENSPYQSITISLHAYSLQELMARSINKIS